MNSYQKAESPAPPHKEHLLGTAICFSKDFYGSHKPCFMDFGLYLVDFGQCFVNSEPCLWTSSLPCELMLVIVGPSLWDRVAQTMDDCLQGELWVELY